MNSTRYRLNKQAIEPESMDGQDRDLLAEISSLEEKLLDAFMAGAEWLEEFRTGKKLEWWADRQKAMGYALDAQEKILARLKP